MVRFNFFDRYAMVQRKVKVGDTEGISLFLLYRGRRERLDMGGVVLGPGGRHVGASERAW